MPKLGKVVKIGCSDAGGSAAMIAKKFYSSLDITLIKEGVNKK